MGVQVTGLRDTRKALKELEPETLKGLDREMRRILRTVTDSAKATAPRRTGEMAKGYKPSLGKANRLKSSYGWNIVNKTRQGSILEFAGKASRGNTTQGRSLIESLDRSYGKPGRFLWSAWDRHKGEVMPSVERAVQDTERAIQQMMDQASGTGV